MAEASDHRVPTPQGALFARHWSPGKAATFAGAPAEDRDFPAALCEATGRRVLAYDRLGFGRSDAHPGRLSARFVGEEAETSVPALCAAFGFERIIPFGHSVGGGMAAMTAATLPERCAGLITIAAQAMVEERTLEGIRTAKAAFAEPGQIERLARYHGERARWVLEAWTETWLSPEFRDWSLIAHLPHVRCPALVIHGLRDDYGSVDQPRTIARLAGGGARLVLPDCGHMPHREAADEVMREVVDFLRDLS